METKSKTIAMNKNIDPKPIIGEGAESEDELL
jgi:hypothetical protein